MRILLFFIRLFFEMNPFVLLKYILSLHACIVIDEGGGASADRLLSDVWFNAKLSGRGCSEAGPSSSRVILMASALAVAKAARCSTSDCLSSSFFVYFSFSSRPSSQADPDLDWALFSSQTSRDLKRTPL